MSEERTIALSVDDAGLVAEVYLLDRTKCRESGCERACTKREADDPTATTMRYRKPYCDDHAPADAEELRDADVVRAAERILAAIEAAPEPA
mgnify:CR=1 FL=1